jgi:OPA family sugar phosphate sensor protein UhpC-like MFS transporter
VSSAAPTVLITARRRAIVLSWLAYASYYLGRKGFSVVKASLAREQGLTTSGLALIDTVYLVAYALGQLPSGVLVDRCGSRRVLSVGLCGSALACALFASGDGLAWFALFFTCNGVAQATGWPASTKVMAQWTETTTRGKVLGWWSTCYQVGGIAATALATWLLAHYGWRAAFYVPAFWLAALAVLLGFALPSAQRASPQLTAAGKRSELGLALRVPLLYAYGASYFCIKLIRYSLLFWLPYYLHTAAGLREDTSGYVSTAFEVGGTLGCVLVGQLSDRFARVRGRVAGAALFGLALALLAYAAVDAHALAWHIGALALIGALLFGPDALLSGAAAQEAVPAAAAASAVGLVNGLGSLGALLQGALTVAVQRAIGWSGLFYVFVGLASISALVLLLPCRPSSSTTTMQEVG